MKKTLQIADLFCGAGGTSTGARLAAERAGYKVKITAINHWSVAVATHTANHPSARHRCTNIDDVDPRKLFTPGQLDVLWASPECTHHSRARGGKPMHDQSRATAWCVTRWAEALLPGVIFIENVPEFLDWGPLGTNGRPMVSKRGATFRAWVGVLESLGYKVDHRVLCAADFGAPTTRSRLFVQAVRGHRKISWPERTHAPAAEIERLKEQHDLFGMQHLKPWVAARDIIDWSLPGRWLDEMPGKAQYDGLPLSPKTLARIHAGLMRYGLKGFIVPGQTGKDRVRSLDKPLQTITTESRGIGFVKPFIVPHFGERPGQQPRAHDVNSPLPAVTGQGAGSLVEPFIVEHIGTAAPQIQGSGKDINDPLSTIRTSGGHHSLVEPYIVPIDHTGNGQIAVNDINQPLSTVTTEARHCLVDPYLIEVAHGDGCGRGNSGREKSLDKPLGSLPCTNRFALAQPFIISTAHGGTGERSASVETPLRTICGNRGEEALIEPHLLPQHTCGLLRPVSAPVPTIATAGAIALVEPYLTKFYGTAEAATVDAPLDTITCKDRFGLVQPQVVIDGTTYTIRLRWRMLQPHELAAGMSFPKDYQFTGTKTDTVKQIGNAVCPEVAAALQSCHLPSLKAA